MATGTQHLVDRVGCFTPKIEQLTELAAGEIGFITAQIKEVAPDRGRRHHHRRQAARRRGAARLQGSPAGGVLRPVPDRRGRFRQASRKPRSSCASTTPASASKWNPARHSASASAAASSGLLHLEIIQERLTREYDLDLITTAPSVVYKMHLSHSKNEDAKSIELHNPADMPDPNRIESIEEPWIEATIYVARRISRPDPEIVPGPARHPEEPDLCRRAARSSHTNCRSTKWCSISTIG